MLMNRMLSNIDLMRVVTIFIVIFISLGVVKIFGLDKGAYIIIFIATISYLFFEWLRAKKVAKNIKKFMLFKMGLAIIIMCIALSYFILFWKSNSNLSIFYIIIYTIIGFIHSYIEKKYLIKNTINETNS